MRRITIAAVLLLAAAAIAGVARPEGAHAVEGQPPSSDSITVSGSGSVASVPTTALFSFGVDARAATARAALAANGRDMREVIAAVKAAGGREVRTQSLSLSQVLGQNSEPAGFAASNVVSATVDVDRAGAVIDAAVGAGANQVNGPTMSVADAGKLYRQALKAAVADARLSAETLAAAAGRSLGKVTSVVENSGATPVPMFAKSIASDAGTPVEAGSSRPPGARECVSQVGGGAADAKGGATRGVPKQSLSVPYPPDTGMESSGWSLTRRPPDCSVSASHPRHGGGTKSSSAC
jgi:uncharacterized protein YggE